ncbi:DNA-binding transcriptional regulator YbjK [Saccharothrix ecbatanensis]|uniref:DNA-binding transcriptional regulator YbjK n=1 Tax=Saccharothrix ecbatanensis TaxID=1105145 RepID=A0A7W9HQ68_9PSEU|nr:TetR/AcrR family transcriptional regulator [Saccharothrix ecbatanensis]MBB5806418.1 DNA-binding transcriptional regulator YbjK [Saccharothrix ecbatanensis]
MTKQQQVLDAAIRVLGSGGMRQLTHRAVDTAAGLPQGSTSNHFRTRDALITGVLDRLLERETELWGSLAGDVTTPDAFARTVGALVERLAADPAVTLARHALFVEVAQRPELRPEVDRAHREIAGWAVPLIAGLGSTDPRADLAVVLALVDGLLANHLANPREDFDPTAVVRRVLRGIFAG